MSAHAKVHTEEIELRGHIIDSWVLPRVFEAVMDLGGEFEVLEIQVGKKKDETSHARLRVAAPSAPQLAEIVAQLQELGAEVVGKADVETKPAHR